MHMSSRQTFGRPFQFNRVAFWIVEVHGRTFALGAITRFDRAGIDAMIRQVRANAGCIEGIDAQAEMIHVATFTPRRRTTFATQLSINRDQIDQRTTGAQLDQTNLVLTALDRATQHVAIERQHCIEIDDAKDKVIDFVDLDHVCHGSTIRMRRV